jgi:hypothetical protein
VQVNQSQNPIADQLFKIMQALEEKGVVVAPPWAWKKNYLLGSRISRAIKKFGIERTAEYLSFLWEWAVEGVWPNSKDPDSAAQGVRVGEYLLKNVEIFAALNGPPTLPKKLFRGVSYLNKRPPMKGSVLYTNKRPFVSWTTSWDNARFGYCAEGVLLSVETSVLLANSVPFLYPFQSKDLLDLKYDQVGNSEIAVKIEKPFPVFVDFYCGSEEKDVDDKAVFENQFR